MVSSIGPVTWRAEQWIGPGGPNSLFHAQRRSRVCLRRAESPSRYARFGSGILHPSQSKRFGGRKLEFSATSLDYELYQFDEDDLENEKAKADAQDEKSQCEDLAHKEVITLVQTLPDELNALLLDHPKIHDLIEIVMDLGRSPQANFGDHREHIRQSPVTGEELEYVVARVGAFGNDDRAGIEGTLHRVSCIRDWSGVVIGLTLAVGKPVIGPAALLEDILQDRKSVLILGPPGIGKTTVLRDVARVMSCDMKRKVMIVDTFNEIGGCGNIPHPFIGESRRVQVPNIDEQHNVMVQAVQNHRPDVLMLDEVGRQEEVEACRSISERGVQMIATVHVHTLENLIKNPQLVGLVGGIHTVIVGDTTAVKIATDFEPMKKTIREREGPSAFDVLVEMRSREEWYIHDVEISVDQIIKGQEVRVQVRSLDTATGETVCRDTICIPTGCPGPPSESFTELGEANGAAVRQQVEKKAPQKENNVLGMKEQAQQKEKKAQTRRERVQHEMRKARKLLQQLDQHEEQFKVALEVHVSKRLRAQNCPMNRKGQFIEGAMKMTKKKMDKLLSQPSNLIQEHAPANPDIDSAALAQELKKWVAFSAEQHRLKLSMDQYESVSHLLGIHATKYIDRRVSGLGKKEILKKSSVACTKRELASVLKPLIIELVKSCKPHWSEEKIKSAVPTVFNRVFDQVVKMWEKPEKCITSKGGNFEVKTKEQHQIYAEFHRMAQEAGHGVGGIDGEKLDCKAKHLTSVAWCWIGRMDKHASV